MWLMRPAQFLTSVWCSGDLCANMLNPRRMGRALQTQGEFVGGWCDGFMCKCPGQGTGIGNSGRAGPPSQRLGRRHSRWRGAPPHCQGRPATVVGPYSSGTRLLQPACASCRRPRNGISQPFVDRGDSPQGAITATQIPSHPAIHPFTHTARRPGGRGTNSPQLRKGPCCREAGGLSVVSYRGHLEAERSPGTRPRCSVWYEEQDNHTPNISLSARAIGDDRTSKAPRGAYRIPQ